MKRIAHVYIILFPYLFVVTLYWLICSLDEVKWLIPAVLLVGLCSTLGVASVIVADIISGFKLSPFEACVWNLVIRAGHLPAHLLCLLLFGGMMNPFLMLMSWIPLLLSICLQGIAGFASIGACISGGRKKIWHPGIAVLFGFLSFIYVLDFIVAIVMLVMADVAKKKAAKQA